MDIRLTSAKQQHCWMDQGLLMPMQAVPTWAPSADKENMTAARVSLGRQRGSGQKRLLSDQSNSQTLRRECAGWFLD